MLYMRKQRNHDLVQSVGVRVMCGETGQKDFWIILRSQGNILENFSFFNLSYVSICQTPSVALQAHGLHVHHNDVLPIKILILLPFYP